MTRSTFWTRSATPIVSFVLERSIKANYSHSCPIQTYRKSGWYFVAAVNGIRHQISSLESTTSFGMLPETQYQIFDAFKLNSQYPDITVRFISRSRCITLTLRFWIEYRRCRGPSSVKGWSTNATMFFGGILTLAYRSSQPTFMNLLLLYIQLKQILYFLL